jgi:hypothetical protein
VIAGAAAAIVHNTERSTQVIAARDRVPVQRLAIANGYDDAAGDGRPDPRVFRVVFSGWLHPYMDVRVLLAACGRLMRRHGLGPAEFAVDFMGPDAEFGGVPLAGLARHYGLQDVFTLAPRGSRAAATRLQESAWVLAAFDYPFPLSVVMKFYDYARMRGTMLLVGNPEGALADAASRLGLRVFRATDEAGIDAHLDAALARWRSGEVPAPLDRDELFHRRHQSEKFRLLLEGLARRPAAR